MVRDSQLHRTGVSARHQHCGLVIFIYHVCMRELVPELQQAHMCDKSLEILKGYKETLYKFRTMATCLSKTQSREEKVGAGVGGPIQLLFNKVKNLTSHWSTCLSPSSSDD